MLDLGAVDKKGLNYTLHDCTTLVVTFGPGLLLALTSRLAACSDDSLSAAHASSPVHCLSSSGHPQNSMHPQGTQSHVDIDHNLAAHLGRG